MGFAGFRPAACFRVAVFCVVVHEPSGSKVRDQVDLGIRQRGQGAQHHGGTVRLDSLAGKKGIYVGGEGLDGNALIGIIAREVDAHQRNKADFGMFAQDGKQCLAAALPSCNAVNA